MKTPARNCSREADVRRLVLSGIDDPEARSHARECAACGETLSTAIWMRELAELPIDAKPLPNPAYLWWKAQLLRRWEAERKASAPIEVGERVQIGVGLAGAAVLLVWLWRTVHPLAARATAPDGLTLAFLASAALLAATAVAAARELLARE